MTTLSRRSLPGLLSLLAVIAAACSPTACAPAGPAVLPTPEVAAVVPPPAVDVRTLHRAAEEAPPPVVEGRSAINPAELDLDWREIIAPNRIVPGSLSLGTTSDGHLVGDAVLPEDGEHHAVIDGCRVRETNFGTEELVEVILHAGAEVERSAPGARLMVCNMGFKGGGHLKWSHSHNSGRDADLAFYMLRDGAPVDAPALVAFGGDLRSMGGAGLTFDIERNWLQIRALLTHPTVQVQWLFISNPLKDAVLGWAREHGESAELIARAESVLWQPTDSSPHNDHLHLRIYCSRQDVLEGCVNTGPVWAWVNPWDDARRARASALTRGLNDPDEATRLAILDFLVKIDGQHAAPELARKGLFDPSPKVRLRSLDILATWRSDDPSVRDALERFIRAPGGGVLAEDPAFSRSGLGPRVASTDDAPLPGESGPEPLQPDPIRTATMLDAAWRTLGLIADGRSVGFLTDALASKRRLGEGRGTGRGEPAAAAAAARHLTDPRLVPALIAALDNPDADVREAAADTLRRITNHSFKVNWARAKDARRRQKDVNRWTAWWASNGHKSRSELLLDGFRESGVKLKSLEGWDAVDTLVKVTGRDDHIGYNADRLVSTITGRWSPRDASASSRSARWKKWWKKNERRVRKRWTK